jgi:hypothetical protein
VIIEQSAAGRIMVCLKKTVNGKWEEDGEARIYSKSVMR